MGNGVYHIQLQWYKHCWEEHVVQTCNSFLKLETADVLNHIPRAPRRVYLDTTKFLVTSVKTSATDVI